MDTYLLYCDLTTMNCTSDDIEHTLSSFAKSYTKVNSSLWLFKYTNGFDGNPLPKEEHLFYDYFEKFVGKDGVVFIDKLHDSHFYQLPDVNHHFLQQD